MLSEAEQIRLLTGIKVILGLPFIDDIEDFVWEAMFSYVKGILLVHPSERGRTKRVFDIVDGAGHGWSAKTIQIAQRSNPFWIVVARANILNNSLSMTSDPQLLGDTILTFWNAKVDRDAVLQGVSDRLICVLAKAGKANRRSNYFYFEEPMKYFLPDQLVWSWLEKGLTATSKASGLPVYRWYQSGAQLFENFQIPHDAVSVTATVKPIDMTSAIDALLPLIDRIK